MQKLMKRVVYDKDGTAAPYKMNDVEIIAKTGTGEVAGKNGYDGSLYTNSVMMAAPAMIRRSWCIMHFRQVIFSAMTESR